MTASDRPGVVRQQLVGARAGDRRDPDTVRTVPVEVGADGALKVLPRGARWRLIASTVLGSSSTSVLTAPKAYQQARVLLINVDSAMRTFRLYLRVGGEAEADANAVAKDLGIAPGDRREFLLGLGEGDVISGQASTASKITCLVMAQEDR